MNLCFVIQPFDGAKYDRRYFDIIKPAIEACGFKAYRVDEDSSVETPIKTIETKISEASLIIAEISTNNPNVWFELGYALALRKKVIMMCSDERESAYPFDVRHRNIFSYKTKSLSDFMLCKEKLIETIRARCNIVDSNHRLTKEELFLLKFISCDQKTSFAITAEEKIIQNSINRETASNCLKSLITNGYLEYRYSTSTGDGYYQTTSKAEDVLNKS